MARKSKSAPKSEEAPVDPNDVLRSKRRNLKDQLDRIYYTLPYDEVAPVLNELKDTIECLTEMGETHTWQKQGEVTSHRNRRRAA